MGFDLDIGLSGEGLGSVLRKVECSPIPTWDGRARVAACRLKGPPIGRWYSSKSPQVGRETLATKDSDAEAVRRNLPIPSAVQGKSNPNRSRCRIRKCPDAPKERQFWKMSSPHRGSALAGPVPANRTLTQGLDNRERFRACALRRREGNRPKAPWHRRRAGRSGNCSSRPDPRRSAGAER